MPVTTAGLTPFGQNHSLVEGADVFGFFRDEEMQEFVVLGVQQGITQDGYKEDTDGNLVIRQLEFGFSDPRRHKKSDYEGTADGLNPPASPQRPNELAVSLKEAPHLVKELKFEKDGSKVKYTKTEFEDSEKTLPYYPLKTNTSDVNQFSALDKQPPKDRKSHTEAPLHRDLETYFPGQGGFGGGIKSSANPQYPYNHATYTESGHLFELDDTRSFERVSLQHRSGTYFEWQSDGDAHERIVKDKYEVILGDDEVYIGGKVNVKVLGDAKITVRGKTDVSSTKDLSVTAPNIKLYGNVIKLNS
tara:strand:- start:166 stop:1074 length:909 start_codon:yes stop_codon:yes gene_type:complete